MESSARYINPYKLFVGSFVPNWLLRCPDLSPGSKLCYARLCQYAGADAVAWPAQETLAAELGCSEREARRYLKELAKAGLIEVERRGLGKPNRYRFLNHPWISAAGAVLERTDVAVQDGTDLSDKENHRRESVTPSASSEDFPNPLPQPPQAASFRETVAAFYEAPKNRKVGALIDMARSLGIERSGQAAKLITDFGAGRDIVQALQAAAAEARGDPWPYMRKVLKNGSRQTRREPARSRQAVATKRQLAWGQLYADAKTDELAPPDGWEPGDPVPVGSARAPA